MKDLVWFMCCGHVPYRTVTETMMPGGEWTYLGSEGGLSWS